MKNISFFKEFTNLNNEKVTFTWLETQKTKIILTIRWKYSTVLCPCCGTKTSKREDRKLALPYID